ncbi:DUF6455 family protein [Roseovarius rhodophyticola]|uniref:DUF6455 family protein n=1 Tax=Roseovarius rhodophyticola TaxID=3080827 RepID=A0ABZ2TCT2_9RHOB|nr:DUF6455 family protein [Roseovarius sp. W115]MDV2930768.1 DUF6455 family protein [Roseovarius sp. W115]
MADTITIKHHADLVDRMAETLGVDLEEKVLEGLLDPSTLSEAVLGCTGCADPEGCELWLQAHQGVGASSTPVMCRNASMFDTLIKGKRA